MRSSLSVPHSIATAAVLLFAGANLASAASSSLNNQFIIGIWGGPVLKGMDTIRPGANDSADAALYRQLADENYNLVNVEFDSIKQQVSGSGWLRKKPHESIGKFHHFQPCSG